MLHAEDRAARLIKLLYAARGIRAFGDGFVVILLPVYLSAIGYDPVSIGVIATLALLGSSMMTLGTGLIAGRFDPRSLMIAGAFLMLLTGLAVPNFERFVFIALVAIFGTLNPSSSDVGPLVPLEHAMLAGGGRDADRTRIFARYSFIGAMASAAGALVAAAPDFLTARAISHIDALRLMFYFYALLGLAGASLYWMLPAMPPKPDEKPVPLGPSRGIVFKLAALFSIDAFAGGLVVQSLLALWLFEKFELSLSSAAVFFFWTSTLSAFSYPVAVILAKRFGLVNTMVFTHIPSSLFLIIAAFSNSLAVVLGLLLLRAALSQMDVPTRTSYVMAVVTPAERPAAASVTAVPRSLAASLSPALAGVLMATPFSGLPLVLCGILKIGYDVALLYAFRHIKPPEEESP
jgi:MFS family permease